MRYYLIAGEASGDIHGANLIQALKTFDSTAVFRAWGGDRMHREIGSLVMHFRDTAFMGFVDVIKNLGSILGNLSACKKDINSWRPDAVILIDYPGFNIRIAEWLNKSELESKIVYYISPQVWAWKAGRANKLKRIVDEMLVILPFEPAFYKKYDFDVSYVGHPLLDELKKSPKKIDFRSEHGLSDDPIVALLPGSRKQEINNLLEIMLHLTDDYPNYQFIIAGLSNIPNSYYSEKLDQYSNVCLILDDTPAILQAAKWAIVASGTATLLTALYQVPQIVVYRGSTINYWIAKYLINIKYISLVNLILDHPLIVELIQNDLTIENLKQEFIRLQKEEIAEGILAGYKRLKSLLGGSGASQQAAKIIFELVS